MNIEDILRIEFEKPDLKSWRDLAGQQLKTDDIDKSLKFFNFEGLDIDGLNIESKRNFQLTSFPKECVPHVLMESHFDEYSIESTALGLDVENFYRLDADINGSHLHNAGSTLVHELSYILEQTTQNLAVTEKDLVIQVSLDSLSFLNISKLRALRYMLDCFYEQNEIQTSYKIITVQSLREQSIFEPWMNMLRATSITTSALVGGADAIALTSYDYAFAKLNKKSINLLGLRNSLNMFKVLVEESSLKKVLDPCAGSYAIENMTNEIILKVQAQIKLNTSIKDLNQFYSDEALINFERRSQALNTRNLIMSGVNNFINLYEDLVGIYKSEHISVSEEDHSLFPLRRLAQNFEALRLKTSIKQFKVQLLCIGSESELSNRINFCQNYFETAGIETEKHFISFDELGSQSSSYSCICSSDEMIDLNKEKIEELGQRVKLFLSGKKRVKYTQNLFMGQNIYEVLSKFEESV